MAENSTSEKSLNDLEKEITCSLCHEHYKDPKLLLSCCHYYCKQCILDLAEKTGLDKPFPCPECRKDTTLPQGSVDNLQAAFFVSRLKGIYSKLQQATGKVEVKCELCNSEDKAEAYCHQCAQFICAECEKSHLRMRKAFPDHKIMSIEELKKGGADIIFAQEPTFRTCKWHKQPMNMYCFDCSCLICRDCTIKDHREHNFEFVLKSAIESKETLNKHMQLLISKADRITNAIKYIRNAKFETDTQGKSVHDSIEKSFEELYQILDKRKRELQEEAATKKAHKLERLSSQEESLSLSCKAIQSVVEYTKQCMKHLNDDEIMVLHTELWARLDMEIEKLKTDIIALNPVEEANMRAVVSCAKELKELCKTRMSVQFGTKKARKIEFHSQP